MPDRCRWGHSYSPENTRINLQGYKECRHCCTARVRAYRRGLKLADYYARYPKMLDPDQLRREPQNC